MGPTTKGEATAQRCGGLRARVLAFLAHPALHRVVALTIGLGALGALGQCLGSPAAAMSIASASASPPPPPPPLTSPLTSPSTSPVPSPSSPDAGSALLDLNAATVDDLRRLPGIGPKRAHAIIELRAKLGAFKKLEDLLRIRGIGRAAMRRLRPLVAVAPPPPKS